MLIGSAMAFWKALVETVVPQGTGTAIGDMTAGGGLAAAFDGNTAQSNAATCYEPASGVIGYVGKDWGAGVTKVISKAVSYPSQSVNTYTLDVGATSSNVTWTVQGSTDNFGSSIVSLGTLTAANNSGPVTITCSGSTAYRYARLKTDTTAAGGSCCTAEVYFYELI